MRLRWGEDLATGLLFIAIGVGALIVGWDYPMGSLQKPDTGVLPHMLAWGLIGIGGVLLCKSITMGDVAIEGWSWRPLIMVTIATVAFGLTIDRLGLVVAMILSMVLSSQGSDETRWREFSIFVAIMIASSWAVFIWLLGMPIPVWPPKVWAWLTAAK